MALADRGKAKALFAEATEAYKLGRFDAAVEKYRAAYDEEAIPAFLFNIAQAYFQAGDYKQAAFFYGAYVRDAPEARNRALAETRLRESNTKLEEQRLATEALERQEHVRLESERLATERAASEAAGKLEEQRRAKAEAEARLQAEKGAAAEEEKLRAEAELSRAEVELQIAEAEAQAPIYKRSWFWPVVAGTAAGSALLVVGGSAAGAGIAWIAIPRDTLPQGDLR